MGGQDKLADLDFENEGEESSIANVNGFLRLNSQLMVTITQAEIQEDYYKLYKTLRSLFSWLYSYFDEDDRKKIQNLLDQTQQAFVLAQKYERQGFEKGSQQEQAKIIKNLYEIKIECSTQMKDANLLTPTREKGLAIYN